MAAAPKLDVSPTVVANARRAADKLRKSMAAKGRAAGKQVAFKTDSRTVRPLLKLVDAISAQQMRAPRGTADGDEITPNHAAAILRMSRPSVMRLIEQGELHPRMVHSRHKLLRAEVVALAERQTRERRKALANLTELTEEYGF
ncbi:MAG TPA: helix-turn-helix domain-containing protein [Acetobacteraceae bacterium]